MNALARAGLLSLAGAAAFLLVFPSLRASSRRPSIDVARLASPDAPGVSAAIDSLERLGLLREAVSLANAEVADREESGSDPRAIASARVRLGDLLVQQGENRDAIEVLDRALRRCGNDPRVPMEERAAILLALGRAEKNEGIYGAAEAHYAAALRLSQAAGAAGRRVEARTLISTANLIRRDASERPRAVRLFDSAQRVLESLSDLEPGDLAGARSGQALVLLQLGEAVRAESLLAHSVPATIAALGPAHPDVGLAHSLWGWSQYLLGRHAQAEVSFRSAMRTYELARDQSGPGASRRRVLQRVALNLAGALLAQGRGTEALEALEAGLSSYLVERLVGAAARETTTGRPGGTGFAETRTRLRDAIDEGSAVIGWVEVNLVNEAPRDVWGFVLRREGPVHWVRLAAPAPDAPMTGPAWDLQEALSRDASWPVRVFEHDEARRVGQEAWAERIAPLEPFLGGVRQLIVINAWSGAKVPIEAFVDPSGQPLLGRYVVTYAPSVLAYLALRDRARTRNAPTGAAALLVGDAGGRVSGRPGVALARLPGSNRELEGIAAVLSHATVLADGDPRSTRRLATSNALGHYEFLHFATHATTDARVPGGGALLFGSASLEAGADSSALVTAAEIESWRLRARLVSLSGCHTSGLHLFGTAPGLAESFLVAGAAGVVVCMWSAEDLAAALLMRRFYENLAPGSGLRVAPPAALRDAKLWLRDFTDERGRRPFRNPAYWSGFVFIGAGVAAGPADDRPAPDPRAAVVSSRSPAANGP